MGLSLGSLGGLTGAVLGSAFGATGAEIGYNVGSQLGEHHDSQKASKQAYNREITLWNMNNDYNSPVSQMQRLEEAGLNPNLVYQNGATHQATMATAPAAAKVPTAKSVNWMANAQMANMEAQNKNLHAQSDNLESQNGLIEAQKGKAIADSDVATAQASYIRSQEALNSLKQMEAMLRIVNYHRDNSSFRKDLYQVARRIFGVGEFDDGTSFFGNGKNRNIPRAINPNFPAIGSNLVPGTGTQINFMPWQW